MSLAFLLLYLLVLRSHALKYHGADISSLSLVESQGVTFTDAGKVSFFETILQSHECNTARIRVWTAGHYSLSYGLKLAKRVKAAKMTLMVDLHFSDTWADPGHQAIPSGWPTTLSGLNTKIFNYTQNIVQQFAVQDTPIDILQVGNEINNGLLWPVGEVSVNGMNPVSQILHSAINGARAAGFRGQTLIHLANGWNWNGLSSFFLAVFIKGALATTDVDIIGVSFYPFYDAQATLAALKSSLMNLANMLGKPIVIAETNWPVTCPNVILTEPSIPVSASGQETWVTDIKNILLALPGGLGQGIFGTNTFTVYWEPGWVGSANLGTSCADNLVVTPSGATRTSINIFRDM